MALKVTDEIRQQVRDEFIFDNQEHIKYFSILLQQYRASKTTLEDLDLVQILNVDMERLEDMSANILFTFATMDTIPLPIQTVGGMILNFISPGDKIEQRSKAMFCSMEILIEATRYVEVFESQNGHLMVQSKISDDILIMKNIAKPLLRPTNQHKALGKFDWEIVESDALFKLNNTPMIMLPIIDIEPPKPSGKKYSKDYKKQQELVEKWKMRKKLGREFKDETIYFNWAADYRGRMYPVGYYYNPQGTELEKNMIGFADGEKLNFHGIQSYKKAIASAFGLDKATDEDKLLWFISNQDNLDSLRTKAKEIHTFDALLYGWNQHKTGQPVTVPLENDASNSFAQFASVLLGDETIASTCNVVNIEDKDETIVISDLYQLIADEMSDLLA